MHAAEVLFDEIVNKMMDIKPGKMFGAKCIYTPNGKSAALYWKSFLVVKLDPEMSKEVLSLDGTKIFEPMEGRTMNGWIQVPYDYRDNWYKFTEAAISFVRPLPAKK